MYTQLKIYLTKAARQRTYLLLILLVGGFLVLRLPFINGGGAMGDESCWMNWSYKAFHYGIAHVYDIIPNDAHYSASNVFTVPNYPPGLIYILDIIALFIHNVLHARITDMSVYIPVFKSFILLVDCATSYLLFKIARKHLSLNQSLIVTCFYALNPYVAYDSVFWGQTDNLIAFFLVLAIYALDSERLFLAYLSIALGMLIKMQFIVFLPLLFIYLLVKYGIKKQLIPLLSSIILFGIFFIPFILQNTFWTMLYNSYLGSVGYYPIIDMDANNLWSFLNYFIQFSTQDDRLPILFELSGRTIGLIIFALFYLIAVMYVWLKARTDKIKSLALGAGYSYVAFYCLNTEMHERYMFPAFILLAIALIWLPVKYRIIYTILSITQLISLTFYLHPSVGYYNFIQPIQSQSGFYLSIINLICLFFIASWINSDLKKSQQIKSLFNLKKINLFLQKEIKI